jgi:hypothetical protein
MSRSYTSLAIIACLGCIETALLSYRNTTVNVRHR